MNRLEVDKILLEREQAREEGDWEKSDSLRSLLADHGVKVIDTDRGQDADAGTEYELHNLKVRVSRLNLREKDTHSELVKSKNLVKLQKSVIIDFLWEKHRKDYLKKGWLGTCQLYKEVLLEKEKKY